MGAGLIDLIAKGEQDTKLTGNPQITFFKLVYRRHTNFSIETVELPLPNINYGLDINVDVIKTGDLLHRMWLQWAFDIFNDFDYENNQGDHTVFRNLHFKYISNLGSHILKETEILIGDKSIDKHYSHFANVNSVLQNENLYRSFGNVNHIHPTSNSPIYLLVEKPIENTGFLQDLSIGAHTSPFKHIPSASTNTATSRGIFNYDQFLYNNTGSSQAQHEAVLKECRGYINNTNLTRYQLVEGMGVGGQLNTVSYPMENSDPFRLDTTTYLRPTTFSEPSPNPLNINGRNNIYLNIPLKFWFCKNPGLSLPLVALNNERISLRLSIEHRDKLYTDRYSSSNARIPISSNIYYKQNPSGSSVITEDSNWDYEIPFNFGLNKNLFKLYGDYIFLDTDERRRFMQISHEYLIEQVQFNSKNINDVSTILTKENNSTDSATVANAYSLCYNIRDDVLLNFTSPVKEIFWTFNRISRGEDVASIENPLLRSQGETVKRGNIGISFNGEKRVDNKHCTYYTRWQPNNYHTGNSGSIKPDSICVYSFALKPEDHQPSGTCNFSRIDNAVLNINVTLDIPYRNSHITQIKESTMTSHLASFPTENFKIMIYAINYNILRITNGKGILAYSR